MCTALISKDTPVLVWLINCCIFQTTVEGCFSTLYNGLLLISQATVEASEAVLTVIYLRDFSDIR